jgi:hypothetical protein
MFSTFCVHKLQCLLCGKLVGITVRPGFGFIQFEREQDAVNAVASERGSSLKGFLLGKLLLSVSDLHVHSQHSLFLLIVNTLLLVTYLTYLYP